MSSLIVQPRSRLFHGHVWVYASDVKARAGDPKPGDVVMLKDIRNRPIGSAIYNPQSQINAEILKGLVKLNVENGNHEGLKLLASADFIPDFHLATVQKWIDEVVRERFNLEPVKEKPVKAAKTQAPVEEVQEETSSTGEEGLAMEPAQS